MKIRIIDDILPDKIGNKNIKIQQTLYSNSLATNEICEKVIRSSDSEENIIDGRQLISNNFYIYRLDQSICSNHVGTSTMVLTSDNKLIVTRQKGNAAQNEHRIAPSGSGSADWDDINSLKTLQEVAANGALREFREECTKINHMLRHTTRIIGYCRLLHRGGKPEFFGFSKISENSSIISEFGGDKWTHRVIAFPVSERTVSGLRSAVVSLLERYETESSAQFILNMQFILNWIDNSPDEAEEFLSDAV